MSERNIAGQPAYNNVRENNRFHTFGIHVESNDWNSGTRERHSHGQPDITGANHRNFSAVHHGRCPYIRAPLPALTQSLLAYRDDCMG
jgi:hypothetical protein